MNVAVYGASGYTGRRVARELVGRGQRVLLSGRDLGKLEALQRELGAKTSVRVAPLDDADALAALARDARALVNCAGPFSASVRPVATAALAERCHYVDVSAEDRKSTRLNSSHRRLSRMPSSA